MSGAELAAAAARVRLFAEAWREESGDQLYIGGRTTGRREFTDVLRMDDLLYLADVVEGRTAPAWHRPTTVAATGGNAGSFTYPPHQRPRHA